MQIGYIGYGVRGFGRITDYAIRWTRMVTNKAKHKARVLAFWAKHGLAATIEAFQVKERTLYAWKAKLKDGQGRLEALNEKSTRPHQVRQRQWPASIPAKIAELRTKHPNLGKEKIHCFLAPWCEKQVLRCPSDSTIGNLIRDAGGLRTFPVKVRHNGKVVPRKRVKKTRKPKGFTAQQPGDCGAFDTIEKFIQGRRRYVIR